MDLAHQIFIEAFRNRTDCATELGVEYWRGVLDALESMNLIGLVDDRVQPCPYDNATKKIVWRTGVTEGKRLWTINNQQRHEASCE